MQKPKKYKAGKKLCHKQGKLSDRGIWLIVFRNIPRLMALGDAWLRRMGHHE